MQWYGGLIYRKTVRLLERVQQHMMRMIPGYKHIPYEVRLAKLGLLALQQRQLQGDLIDVLG